MRNVTVKSYAKLNLSLEITGVKDGYHQLDSLVTSIDLSDSIRLVKRKDKLINVYMHGQKSESISPEHNVAQKAGDAFVEKYGVCGADITVFKDIPMGGGLGGSSADAAGVLNGMAKLYEIDDEAGIKSLADGLGSDTGYMLKGGFARMTGRGEQVWRLPVQPRLHFLLLCPSTSVSTGQCYALYDELAKEGKASKKGVTEECINHLLKGDNSGMGATFYNSLYLPACRLNAEVKEAVTSLEAFSPLGYGMTGSGSCAFALFESRELCEWAKSRYRGKCRAIVVKTVDPQEEQKGFFGKLRNPYYLSEEGKKEAEK